VRRITNGYGADIVIDGIGGEVLSEALGALALEGRVTTLGYSASRTTTIDVTISLCTGQHPGLNISLSRRRPLLTHGKLLSLT